MRIHWCLTLAFSAAAKAVTTPIGRRASIARMMCSAADDSLQVELKKAAAQTLGASLEAYMRPEDLVWSDTGSKTMAEALRAAKQQFDDCASALGRDAALNELDASIRSGGQQTSRIALRAKPRLWLLDRDGCINEDVGRPGVLRSSDVRLIRGSAGAMRRLRVAGKVAIITNQSARGKGLLSSADLEAIHEELRHQIARTARGGRASREQWDALYVCEDVAECARKKPEPGMILEALGDFGCSPSEAVMIGDSWSDVVAAHRAGCVGVLLATGHGAALGALLREHGVCLPVTLKADGAATDAEKLQRSLASFGGESLAATDAVEAWIEAHSETEAALIWEALRYDVHVYADLAQAADRLVAVASEL